MSGHIKVSVPRMEKNLEELHGRMEEIPKFVRELHGAMNNLGTCWEGPAWVAFQQQVESDILYLLTMYDWLREYAKAVSEAEKAYGDSEEKSYQCVEQIRI